MDGQKLTLTGVDRGALAILLQECWALSADRFGLSGEPPSLVAEAAAGVNTLNVWLGELEIRRRREVLVRWLDLDEPDNLPEIALRMGLRLEWVSQLMRQACREFAMILVAKWGRLAIDNAPNQQAILDLPVTVLGQQPRVVAALRQRGIMTLRALTVLTRSELRIAGVIGSNRATAIEQALNDAGLALVVERS